MTGVSTIAYSTRGDLTQFGDWAFTYDAAGGLIRAHNTQSNLLAKYWRDADGHRAVKDVDGEKTLFFNLGTTQLEAYDVLTDMASSTIHQPGIDRPLAEVSSSGTLTFYHQDWLGNVAMLTNASGAKVQTYTYDVWGKPSGFDAAGASITPSSFASRLLFTGREYDVETGLYHYRARAYSPTLGRFIQTDPIDFGGGDGNLFRYVRNNPVNWVDPLGLTRGPSVRYCRGNDDADFDWESFAKDVFGGILGSGLIAALSSDFNPVATGFGMATGGIAAGAWNSMGQSGNRHAPPHHMGPKAPRNTR